MSLFVADLAFGPTPQLKTARVRTLAASVASPLAGMIILSKRKKAATA
jgi:Na+/H+ antiporter NhaA